jgi:hypothetical protein
VTSVLAAAPQLVQDTIADDKHHIAAVEDSDHATDKTNNQDEGHEDQYEDDGEVVADGTFC